MPFGDKRGFKNVKTEFVTLIVNHAVIWIENTTKSDLLELIAGYIRVKVLGGVRNDPACLQNIIG